MHVITAPGPETALYEGLWYLKTAGELHESRNGRVLRAPGPVCTAYTDPIRCRVMFNPIRDANPFFHLYESVWMLAGRNDVESVARYAQQMATFSDNGMTLNGAYGFRWRNHFRHDQLLTIIQMLRHDKTTRRAVLGMWDVRQDLRGPLGLQSKDLPCNTHVYFNAVGGRLNMTVCNRSNDVVWGAYGANAVHMSFLLEFVALSAGLEPGTYYQVSNDYHVYVDRPDVQRLYTRPHDDPRTWAPCFVVGQRAVAHMPLDVGLTRTNLAPGYELLRELEHAANVEGAYDGPSVFLSEVFAPVCRAWTAYKAGDITQALLTSEYIQAEDWRMACKEWLQRRAQKLAATSETRA